MNFSIQGDFILWEEPLVHTPFFLGTDGIQLTVCTLSRVHP